MCTSMQLAAISYDECQTALDQLIDAHHEEHGGFAANKLLPIIGGDAASLSRRGNFTLQDVIPEHLIPAEGLCYTQPFSAL